MANCTVTPRWSSSTHNSYLGTCSPAARPDRRYCWHCRGPKTPSAHHCRVCNACVVDLDHHCPFINNCVGRWGVGIDYTRSGGRSCSRPISSITLSMCLTKLRAKLMAAGA